MDVETFCLKNKKENEIDFEFRDSASANVREDDNITDGACGPSLDQSMELE